MKNLSLFLITNLSLFFSFLIHAEEEEINFTADTLVNNMFRSFVFSPQGEEFLLGLKNVDYFYCEGKGVTKTTGGDFFNEETPQPRMEFIFAYRDPNKDEEGLFAVSEPTMLESSWLFVAMKKINEEKWKNIWDSKYSIVRGSHHMEDAVKATINDFILRLDIDIEINSENLFWQKEGEGEIATLSTDWYITMNRNTNKFFWFSDAKKMVRLFAFPDKPVSMDQKTTFEGDCSITKR